MSFPLSAMSLDWTLQETFGCLGNYSLPVETQKINVFSGIHWCSQSLKFCSLVQKVHFSAGHQCTWILHLDILVKLDHAVKLDLAVEVTSALTAADLCSHRFLDVLAAAVCPLLQAVQLQRCAETAAPAWGHCSSPAEHNTAHGSAEHTQHTKYTYNIEHTEDTEHTEYTYHIEHTQHTEDTEYTEQTKHNEYTEYTEHTENN